ncbi:MAG TPA: thioredoxin domain-containing protein [Candidatus Binataceae bacterium]|nr:thioredoxin domain-containing protein [Candidatus Binataceae bacterium]
MRKELSAIRKLAVRLDGRSLLAGAIAAGAAAFLIGASAAAAADVSPVLATVGSHKITQQEVDAKIKVQLYDARKGALDDIVDDYVLQQAARKDHLSVADFLKREIDDKVAADVNDASAKKFYDQNKDRIAALKATPYDKVKDRLIAALRQRDAQQQREALLERLRQQYGVKVLLQPPRVEVSSTGHPTLGPKDAPVKLIEFGDFQCPFCKRAEDTVKQVREKYGDKVEIVFMDFPLSFHDHAMAAANAARCAGEQNKFWQYHDALFADQSKLAPADLKATAKKLGLDTAKFDGCLDKGKYEEAIKKDLAEGRKLNVSGTPTFFIDGRQLVGAQPLPQFQQIIDEELAQAGNHGTKKTAAAN